MPKPKKAKATDKARPFNPAKLRVMMERSLSETSATRRSRERRAQDLVYDAMEAATPQQCLDLSLQALELDPEQADALLMVLDFTDVEGEERIDALRDRLSELTQEEKMELRDLLATRVANHAG